MCTVLLYLYSTIVPTTVTDTCTSSTVHVCSTVVLRYYCTVYVYRLFRLSYNMFSKYDYHYIIIVVIIMNSES